MPRKIQTSATKARKHTIVCQGDSYTDGNSNMGLDTTRWTEQLRRKLENSSIGARVVVCNIAQTGARTDDGGTTGGTGKQMLCRFTPFLRGTPEIAVIWGGTNDIKSITTLTESGTTANIAITAHGWSTGMLADIYGATQSGYNLSGVTLTSVDANNLSYTVGAGLTTPATGTPIVCLQTKLNIRAMIKWLKFGCRGCYRSQTDLPASGIEGDRYVILNDTSSTGGVTALSTTQATTLTGSATAGDPTVWEYRNGQAGVAGWGRIAIAGTTATHTSRVIVMGNHYLNYSSGGDALATPVALYDDVTGIRSKQSAAASAESVIYGDFYTFLRNRIVAGTDVQGDHLWHVADSNGHLSQYGHSLIAEFLLETIQAQSGWVAAIST